MVARKTVKSRKKPILLASIVAILVIAIAGGILLRHHKNTTNNTPSAAKTTSTSPSAQSNFKNGGEKLGSKAPEPSPTNSATDNAGAVTQTTANSALWSKSSDGSSIVVMSPTPNSLFTSGSTVSGTATSNTVHYELEDDVSGVILQGQANVVNGKFSVTFSFSTTGSSGRINVFNQASDGTESNNVAIPVKFK